MNEATEFLDLTALEHFFTSREQVASAFIFGSAQCGEIKKGSDIDLAVLFNTPPSVMEKFEFYFDLCEALDTGKPVDMTVLNGAETILAFEALNGMRIANNNPAKTAAFSSYVSRLYEDVLSNLQYQYSLRAK